MEMYVPNVEMKTLITVIGIKIGFAEIVAINGNKTY